MAGKLEKFTCLKEKNNSERLVNHELTNQLDSFATAQNDCSGYSERQKSIILTISPRPLWERDRVRGKKIAFSLAEVLITLGIIGVVAVLTLPSIINNIQNKQLETAFKKSYSAITQVAQRVVIEEYGGEIPDDELFNSLSYYAKYLNGGKRCVGTNADGCPVNASGTNYCNFMIKNYKDFSGKVNAGCLGNDYIVNVIDGSTYYFDYAGPSEFIFGKQLVIVDINGWAKRPNKLGHDMFMFQINRDGKVIAGGDSASVYPKEQYCVKNSSTSSATNGYGCTIRAINEKDYFKKLPH